MPTSARPYVASYCMPSRFLHKSEKEDPQS